MKKYFDYRKETICLDLSFYNVFQQFEIKSNNKNIKQSNCEWQFDQPRECFIYHGTHGVGCNSMKIPEYA